MILEAWRLDEVLTHRALADRLAYDGRTVTPETVRRWCLPENDPLSRTPDRGWMRRIHEISNGQVTPNDFAGV
jgi:hypothetical protein